MIRRARDLTCLELATVIARAVLAVADRPRRRDATRDPGTQAVLRTLHRTRTWFMRAESDGDGVIDYRTARRLR
jgi:hypothetical protein